MKKMIFFIVCAAFTLASKDVFSSTDPYEGYFMGSLTTTERSRPISLILCRERLLDKDIPSRIIDSLKDFGDRVELSKSITIDLSGNYIADSGVTALVRFLTGFPVISDKLVSIDLSNNRFTNASLELLRDFLIGHPTLEINAAINSFDYADFARVFGTYSDTIRRFRITPY
jgi:hypothetical protein